MSKLDVQSGEVIVSGVISSMIYNEKNIKVTKESIVKKLFK